MQNSTIFRTTDARLLGPTAYPTMVTSESSNQSSDNLSMSLVVQMSWTVVFVIMILTAIFGNCIVIWIVLSKYVICHLVPKTF